jgi:hypothetical protein
LDSGVDGIRPPFSFFRAWHGSPRQAQLESSTG